MEKCIKLNCHTKSKDRRNMESPVSTGDSQLYLQVSSLLRCLETQQKMAQRLGSCYPHGRSRRSSRLRSGPAEATVATWRVN